MSEIVSAKRDTDATLTLKGEEIPFGAYQAIYHKLTKKTEKDIKVYSGAFDISFSDLKNLNHRFQQSIKQYQTKAVRCEVTHSIKRESTRYHSSFEKFEISGSDSQSCTSRVSYELDFLVILPPEVPEASEIAQRFKVTVVIDQDLYEDFHDPFIYIRKPDINNIELSIEFSDYAVFQHLRAVVDEWVNVLQKRDPGFFLSKMRAIERHGRHILSIAIPALACIGAVNYMNAQSAIDIALAAKILITVTALTTSGMWIIEYLFLLGSKFTNSLIPSTYLNFTNGDRNRREQVEKRKGRLRFLGGLCFTGVILATMVNIFSERVYILLYG